VSATTIGAAAARWRREARRTSGWAGLIYVVPALIVLVVFEVWPILFAVWISLWKWDVAPLAYVGLTNYRRLFGEGFVTVDYDDQPAIGEVLKSLIVTVYYVIGVVPVTILIAFALAYLLFQPIRGRELLRTIYFLPYVTSSVAITIVFGWIFNAEIGVVNAAFRLLGLPTQTWLEDPVPAAKRFLTWIGAGGPGALWAAWSNNLAGPSVALVVIIIYGIWSTLGYNIVIYLAGLTEIQPELYEAGRIDGASRWQLMRHITWPLLTPSTFFLSVVNTIAAFQAFTPIYTLTRTTGMGRGEAGGPLDTTLTITVYIFRNFYERANSVGYAAAVSILLFFIILGLTLLQFRVLSRRVHYQ
jgi:multiple sugar transport system permease protein